MSHAPLEELRRQLEQLTVAMKHVKMKINDEENIERVNDHFSRENLSDLEYMQEIVLNLCPDGDHDISSMAKCKRALRGVYINIYDYVDGKYDKKCLSIQALRKRCRVRGFFPLQRAKSEHLKGLLKNLF